jgi:hypothetical protein
VKRCFDSLRKSSPAVLFSIVVLLSGSRAFSQSSAKDAVPVLEGLDPVMLSELTLCSFVSLCLSGDNWFFRSLPAN